MSTLLPAPRWHRPRKIISGGQTGVDRAALDYAICVGIPYGGNVPAGWLAEDGAIDPTKYPNLTESKALDPAHRTELNVRESDGTLVLTRGDPDPGTQKTLELARVHNKPLEHINLRSDDVPTAVAQLRSFLMHNRIDTLNVAGPRESNSPGIYQAAFCLLSAVLTEGWSPEPNAALLNLACQARSEAMANVRHWDQIRWMSPAWLLSLASAIATGLGLAASRNYTYCSVAFLLCAMLGLVNLLLLYNLMVYHVHTLEQMKSRIQSLLGDSPYSRTLTDELPYSFTSRSDQGRSLNLRRTATSWLMTLVGFVTAASLAASLACFLLRNAQ